ncbi:MAG: hypothetical protein SPI77_07250 [Corynebacterium sp.]|nr:hypothetical protein [Corynebacterium sp.]
MKRTSLLWALIGSLAVSSLCVPQAFAAYNVTPNESGTCTIAFSDADKQAVLGYLTGAGNLQIDYAAALQDLLPVAYTTKARDLEILESYWANTNKVNTVVGFATLMGLVGLASWNVVTLPDGTELKGRDVNDAYARLQEQVKTLGFTDSEAANFVRGVPTDPETVVFPESKEYTADQVKFATSTNVYTFEFKERTEIATQIKAAASALETTDAGTTVGTSLGVVSEAMQTAKKNFAASSQEEREKVLALLSDDAVAAAFAQCDPAASDPGTPDPGTPDPGTSDPGTTDPGTTDPGTSDPGTTDPGTTDPGTTDPGSNTGTPSTGTDTNTGTDTANGSKENLSSNPGALAGILIGILLLLGGIGAGVYQFAHTQGLI